MYYNVYNKHVAFFSSTFLETENSLFTISLRLKTHLSHCIAKQCLFTNMFYENSHCFNRFCKQIVFRNVGKIYSNATSFNKISTVPVDQWIKHQYHTQVSASHLPNVQGCSKKFSERHLKNDNQYWYLFAWNHIKKLFWSMAF